jgi:dolichol-phosphate mannosyltransferase
LLHGTKEGPGSEGFHGSEEFLSFRGEYSFSLLVRIPQVKDYTCGYRAYKVGLLKKAVDHYQNDFIKQTGFACMIEILLRIQKFDPIIEEVPLILRYDMKESTSKMKIARTIKQTLSMLFNYTFKNQY